MEAEAKRLAALKEELLKDMAALERVERLMAAKNGSLNRPDERQYPLPINNANRASEDADDMEDSDNASPATSLRATIENLINADPNVRWTTQKVLGRLEEMKFPLRAAKPIYSVGQVLQVLVKKEKIRIARRGAGSQPNIYKGKRDATPTTEDHSDHLDDLRPDSRGLEE